MNHPETVKDMENTFGNVPDFFKNTPQDVMVQVVPVLKKYGLGQSVIPQKYREMMALAAAGAMKCLIVRHFIKKRQRCIELVKELNELAAIVAQHRFGVQCCIHRIMISKSLYGNCKHWVFICLARNKI